MRVVISCLLIAILGAGQTPSSQDPHSSSSAPFPAESRIAFERNMIFPKYRIDAPTPTNIFVANGTEVGGELQLTRDDRSEYPVWSPDGKRIAYIHINEMMGPSKRPRWTSEIILMDADGKDQKKLASFQIGRGLTLSWSPDDKTLAVGGVILGPSVNGQGFVESAIYLLDTASRKSPRLLVERGFSPSWSPDGLEVAYNCTAEVRPGEYTGSVCLVSASNHSTPRVLAENAWYPTWSPNGENIAYLSRVAGKGQLVICHPNGSNIVPLTESKRDVQSFAWSPDGRRIAYTEKQSMDDEVIQSGPLHSVDVPRIFVASMDGTRMGPFGEKDRLWCHDLSWSSDGKFIAAVCASGLRDKTTLKQRFAASLFLLESGNLKAQPRFVAENGVARALFSPR
jgi:Tol biopolymer transport system component